MAGDHSDFWIAVATIAPIAIAINIVTFGQAVSKRTHLVREDETTLTSWLRSKHLIFVIVNFALCLTLVLLALVSLWAHTDAAPAWVTMCLLIAMLVELMILAVCAEALLERADRQKTMSTADPEPS